jgi:hypothetical protein
MIKQIPVSGLSNSDASVLNLLVQVEQLANARKMLITHFGTVKENSYGNITESYPLYVLPYVEYISERIHGILTSSTILEIEAWRKKVSSPSDPLRVKGLP